MNRGIIVFPEGTVKAGRRREDGKIHGLQQFEPNGWHQQFLRQYGSGVAVLPVGLHGGYRVLNPDTFSIDDEVMKIMLGDTPVKKIASIRLGSVRTSKYADITRSSFLMEEIASLIPQEARGSWNAVFEYRPEY